MAKIQIGWKAKDENKKWKFVIDDRKPWNREHYWDSDERWHNIPDHPEQPEIPWEKSLQPVFIEV